MATSGSYDFTLNRDEIIGAALRKLSVLAEGESISAYQVVKATEALNVMVKAWKAKGINLWKYQEMVVFLDLTSQSYDIGPSGDRAAPLSDFVKTELSADAASAAGTINVDSITGIASGDQIGVVLDDGTIHWTTVNGAPAGSTVTLTATLAGAATTDNHVYAYTSRPQRPMRILDARLRREDNTEIPISMISRQEYFAIADKASASIVSQAYYDPQLTNGVLYISGIGETVNDIVLLTAQIQIQDFDATTDNADFPEEWLETLIYNLAIRLAPDYGISLSDPSGVGPDIKEMAITSLEDAMGFDVEAESVSVEPQMEE